MEAMVQAHTKRIMEILYNFPEAIPTKPEYPIVIEPKYTKFLDKLNEVDNVSN